MKNPRATTTERGWPGHFIAAHDCGFRRNTLVEFGKRRVIVSTVGNYCPGDGEPRTIGLGRYYETMAFATQRDSDGYVFANVSREVRFESKWRIDECEDTSNLEADAMHEAVVAEIKSRMENGTLRIPRHRR